jgi:hypothetical protein
LPGWGTFNARNGLIELGLNAKVPGVVIKVGEELRP